MNPFLIFAGAAVAGIVAARTGVLSGAAAAVKSPVSRLASAAPGESMTLPFVGTWSKS